MIARILYLYPNVDAQIRSSTSKKANITNSSFCKLTLPQAMLFLFYFYKKVIAIIITIVKIIHTINEHYNSAQNGIRATVSCGNM